MEKATLRSVKGVIIIWPIQKKFKREQQQIKVKHLLLSSAINSHCNKVKSSITKSKQVFLHYQYTENYSVRSFRFKKSAIDLQNTLRQGRQTVNSFNYQLLGFFNTVHKKKVMELT